MNLRSHLRSLAEPIPSWLERFEPGQPFPRQQFFDSRVVYYPGSELDGQPVDLFGSTHCAHCFVYADYGVDQQRLEHALCNPRERFSGYHHFACVQLKPADLAPNGWRPHVDRSEARDIPAGFAPVRQSPFAFLQVLERDHDLTDAHGPSRLAILFIGGDGIASFDALFAQQNGHAAPFAVVLQDHGFGGNYDSFGGGGLMERIAQRTHVQPHFLLVADNTRPWLGFEPVPGLESECGGMHRTPRTLFSAAAGYRGRGSVDWASVETTHGHRRNHGH